jgi:hypothetical protein
MKAELGRILMSKERMMCSNSEWRKREGAEAIFTVSGIFALVRTHSMEEDDRGMEFCVDRIA